MMPYLFIALLLVCSAFFSSAEIAYASANKSRLKKAAESGSRRGRWAVEISDYYEKTLCAVLIGNNLVNIASSSVATVIAMALVGDAGVAIATGVMTVLLLIFGEIVPKQLGKQFCDSYALAIAPVLYVFIFITRPVVAILMKLVAALNALWGSEEGEDAITYEDLSTIIETVEEEGVIDEECSERLQSAIDFNDTEVQEIVTHRVDMTALDINDSADELVAAAIASEYSRIPVYDEGIDDIIGVLPVNQLLKELLDDRTPDIRELLTEALFVPHTKKVPAVLDQMRRSKIHIAIATDDHGGTLGVVTMEDILEELVGEIWDETDVIDPPIQPCADGSVIVDGDLMLGELLEYLEIEDEELEDYIITVSGWVTEILDDYPTAGVSFRYRDYTVTVLEADEFCASRLSVVHCPEPEEN